MHFDLTLVGIETRRYEMLFKQANYQVFMFELKPTRTFTYSFQFTFEACLRIVSIKKIDKCFHLERAI